MKPEQARSDIIDLYEATKQAVGGDWSIAEQDWSECSTQNGFHGANFTLGAQRLDQPLGSGVVDFVESVQTLWRGRSIKASISVDSTLKPPNHYLTYPEFGAGTAPDGYLVQFTANEKGYADFDATSHCAAGDAYELNHSEPTRGPGGSLFESPAP